MKRLLILLLVLVGFGFSQEILLYNTNHLFKSSETILTDSNGKYYFEMTDVDTATSAEVTIRGGRNGDVRISIWAHATSGTLDLDLLVGIKVADFGADSLNYEWISVDRLDSAEDGATNTYLMINFPEWTAPMIGYKICLITAGTQTTQVKVNVLQFKE